MAHNKTLTELKWFKWALWGPIGVAAIITAIITGFDNYPQPLDWGLSSDHINDAISRLKFPIAIASLAFPLVALVASHHRSVQTAAQITRTDDQILRTDKQIKATDDKNHFENYIKHWEMFNERLDEIGKCHGVIFNTRKTIYDCFFAGNNWKNFRPFSHLDSVGFKSEQEERAREFYCSQKELLQACNTIIKTSRPLNGRDLADEHSLACNTLSQFLDNFGIKLDEKKYFNHDISHTKPIFEELKVTSKVFHMLCIFAFEDSMSGIEVLINQLPSEAMEIFSREQLENKD